MLRCWITMGSTILKSCRSFQRMSNSAPSRRGSSGAEYRSSLKSTSFMMAMKSASLKSCFLAALTEFPLLIYPKDVPKEKQPTAGGQNLRWGESQNEEAGLDVFVLLGPGPQCLKDAAHICGYQLVPLSQKICQHVLGSAQPPNFLFARISSGLRNRVREPIRK